MAANPEILNKLTAYVADKTGGNPPTGGDKDKNVKPSSKAPERIPLPDYNNPASRLEYAKKFREKYGTLMQGRGDTPLRINETPFGGTASAKELSIRAAKGVGLDPALLYASSMEEGMSGIFPDAKGEYDYSGDENFPTQGSASFGLDNFVSRFPTFVKKGYLPANFKERFKINPAKPGTNETNDSANYRTPDDALLAKAAFMKSNYDEVDDYIKKKGLTLSPKARDFFALINYNAGSGTGQQMINDYNANGVLANDAFLKARPTSGKGLKATSYAVPYENVIRRLQMQEALKKEGYFDEPLPQQPPIVTTK